MDDDIRSWWWWITSKHSVFWSHDKTGYNTPLTPVSSRHGNIKLCLVQKIRFSHNIVTIIHAVDGLLLQDRGHRRSCAVKNNLFRSSDTRETSCKIDIVALIVGDNRTRQ